MRDFFGLYISWQILILLSWILIGSYRKLCPQNSVHSTLLVSYGLLLSAFALPLLFLCFDSTASPFGPLLRVNSEPQLTASINALPTLNLQLVPQSRLIQKSASLSSLQLSGVMAVIGGLLLFMFYRFFHSVFFFKKVLRHSILLRKVGRVKLWASAENYGPLSFWFFGAHVVVPELHLSNLETTKISIFHELQHHRQRDTLWVYLLEAIYTFMLGSPWAKWLLEHVYELQEMVCDNQVIYHKKLSPISYGQCLLAMAETKVANYHLPVGAIGMMNKSPQLKRRITKMLRQQNKKSLKSLFGVFLVGTLIMASGAWALNGSVRDQLLSLEEAQKLAVEASAKQKIPVLMNKQVLYWLNHAISDPSRRKVIRDGLERMESYKSLIVSKLDASHLPRELLAVPLVESGYRNSAVSTQKAAGLWQFIPTTARRYGLVVDRNLDERRVPEKATAAALQYYQNLYAAFQNWHVALTAYNVGESRMLGAITEAGHNQVFALASEGLLGGSEGKNYLAKVMASMLILQNPRLVE